MTIDILTQTLQAIGYLLLLLVLALLCRRALRPSEFQRFWSLLAGAWILNLLGNIAWFVHDMVAGTPLAAFSVVDIFYILRYVSIAYALWIYPAALSRQAWLWIGGAMLVVNAIVWAVYFKPAMALRGGDWVGFLGVALYPVLDAGIVVLAWLRFRTPQFSAWSRYTLLLFCGMLSYGIANTLNLTESVFPPLSGGILPNLFWILADIFMLIMVLGTEMLKEHTGSLRNEA